MVSRFISAAQNDQRQNADEAAQGIFQNLIQTSQYVGDVYSMSYESSLVLIHDHYRKHVGGIPSLSFLIATRIDPENLVDYRLEDSSIILLRVMDSAPLPNHSEAERVRVESAQRVSGETAQHWDDAGSMDPKTHNLLSFAGIRCRIIGTFFLERKTGSQSEGDLEVRFGCDLSNYYPNRGLKVYKPNDLALGMIVNYRDVQNASNYPPVEIGHIRYASTNRAFQGISNVSVSIQPSDLLAQKTALFGMTRTGKSNTTKVILQSVFNLRLNKENPLRVGQIVFDPNGEYANENTQDSGQLNPDAIKNIGTKNALQNDVITYGVRDHPKDPNRKLMLLNFFVDANLQTGKEIIDGLFSTHPAGYIKSFCQVQFNKPAVSTPLSDEERSMLTRFERRVLVYRTILSRAGFSEPQGIKPDTRNLFNQELLKCMQNSQDQNIAAAAKILATPNPSWGQLGNACEALRVFLDTPEFKTFDREYMLKKSTTGESWADEDLRRLLGMFQWPSGIRLLGEVRTQHTPSTISDYTDEIYKELVEGKLVIIDQSSGEPELNRSAAERIMWKIFRNNQKAFREAKVPPSILVYVEEAHNILPAGTDMDMRDVWVRTAKEGAKYQLGLVYATQEVSSIQKNILKNTSNWFIGHLNNTDETRELCKYYDFADFEASIRRAQDKGFLRVKTLSNLFVIPVQVKKFEV